MRGKCCIILICLAAILFVPITMNVTAVFAATEDEVREELEDSIDDTLSDVDFGTLDDIVSGLDERANLFGDLSFGQKVKGLINGDFELNFDNIFSCIISLIFGNIKGVIPIMLIIVAIAALSVIVGSFRPKGSEGVSSTIKFACYSAVIIVISSVFFNVIDVTREILTSMNNQIEALMPILMTLLVGVGSAVSVSIYSPIVAVLTSTTSMIFTRILLPLFILAFVFTVIGNMSNRVKITKFVDFISSAFKYIIGFCFTIFSGVLVVQGIAANKYDNISFKATKFAMKSYIPLIGGYLADGFDYVVMGSVLIKNAVGVGGLILILSSILVPIITIVVLRLALMFVASLIEPIGSSEISNFTSSCAKVLSYPIVLILGVAFMYILTLSLVLATGNIL